MTNQGLTLAESAEHIFSYDAREHACAVLGRTAHACCLATYEKVRILQPTNRKSSKCTPLTRARFPECNNLCIPGRLGWEAAWASQCRAASANAASSSSARSGAATMRSRCRGHVSQAANISACTSACPPPDSHCCNCPLKACIKHFPCHP